MLDRIFDLAKINNTINNFSDNMKKLYHDYLVNEFGVLFTYHSNRIEGANTTLTLNDTKNILNETYDNMWMYKNEPFLSININEAHGFIYAIEELSTGKIYVGQKVFWTKKIKTVNKKKKKIKVESDWKKYYRMEK